MAPNPKSAQTAASGECSAQSMRRQPSCTDCHQGHDQPHPDSETFRMRLPDRCGNCHPALSQSYRLTLHGQLTDLGYKPAANCSDCHGAHEIQAIRNPQSRLASANRLSTCRKCHAYATVNFTRFDPHANEKDSVRYPLLYYAVSGTKWGLAFLVGMFALHGLVWFARSFAHTRESGRDPRLAAGSPAVVFFAPVHQSVYLLLIIPFLGLAVTALPLKFSSFAWAQHAAKWMGGFETTRIWHQFFAAALLVGCAIHVVWLVRQWLAARREHRAGWAFWRSADSPLLSRRDFTDLAHMLRWFVGVGRRPTFERWTYWEKLDYWGVFLAVLFVTASGLLLWFPNLFVRFLPGEVLNLAKTVHAELSLMVAGFVLLMHIFNTHLRPEKFPMDQTMFTGLASEQYLQSARPELPGANAPGRPTRIDSDRRSRSAAVASVTAHRSGDHRVECGPAGGNSAGRPWKVRRHPTAMSEHDPNCPRSASDDNSAGAGARGPGTQRTVWQQLRILLLSATAYLAAFFLFGVLLTGAAGWYTSRPQFCNSCHIMEPYYASWQESTHRDVSCIKCHFPPGVAEKARGKLLGLVQLIKYVTASQGPRPSAEVPDASCLRSGCHETRLLSGRVDFQGIPFDHGPHLGQLQRNKQLRCTSCHSQIVQGSHMTVTTSTCFLCHFKNLPFNEGLGACTRCHQIPEQEFDLGGGVKFNHELAYEKGVDCASCHGDLIRGVGEVPPERCSVCHNRTHDLERIKDDIFLHQKHVTDHKVDCLSCHLAIHHSLDPHKLANAAADCTSCHGNQHHEQVSMLEGVGGRTFPGHTSSSMAAARLACPTCHQVKAVSSTGTILMKASLQTCATCHEGEELKDLEAYHLQVKESLNTLTPEMERIRSALEMATLPAERKTSLKATLDDVQHDIDFLRVGNEIHNSHYAGTLADSLLKQLQTACNELGVSPPDVTFPTKPSPKPAPGTEATPDQPQPPTEPPAAEPVEPATNTNMPPEEQPAAAEPAAEKPASDEPPARETGWRATTNRGATAAPRGTTGHRTRRDGTGRRTAGSSSALGLIQQHTP